MGRKAITGRTTKDRKQNSQLEMGREEGSPRKNTKGVKFLLVLPTHMTNIRGCITSIKLYFAVFCHTAIKIMLWFKIFSG